MDELLEGANTDLAERPSSSLARLVLVDDVGLGIIVEPEVDRGTVVMERARFVALGRCHVKLARAREVTERLYDQ